MNIIPIGIATLIAVSFWLIAEIRNASKSIRIVLGLCIMFFLLGQPIMMNDVFVIRQHQYAGCITRIAELLGQGDQKTVDEAMAVWNKDRGETGIGNLDHVNAVLNKVHAAGDAENSHKPKDGDGYVPDAETAIAVAVAVWNSIYGKEHIAKEKPYKASLAKGIWTVEGSLPEGVDGGVAEADISKDDGRILRVIHGK